MIKIRETAFSIVCIVFSDLMLVMCMLMSELSAAENDRAALLSKQVQALEKENRLLYVAAENGMELSELERYATEKLGMQRCSPAQIFYIEHTD